MDALKTMLPELDWESDRSGDETATIELGPFKIVVSKEPEEWYPFIDDLGKGISHPEDGAIKRPNAGWNEYKWFLPATTAEEHYLELATDATWTIDECRTEASSYAMRDFERWEEYNSNEWCYTTIGAKVFYKGYELSHHTCGGVESDAGDEHITHIAWEVVDEAVDEAIKALAEFKDPPTFLLTEFSEQLSAAFKASYDQQRATWTGSTAGGKPWGRGETKRDPKDIPPYVPVHELEWRRVLCARCQDSDITDEDYRCYLGENSEIEICNDCYSELHGIAYEALEEREADSDRYFTVVEIEAEMAAVYMQELEEEND